MSYKLSSSDESSSKSYDSDCSDNVFTEDGQSDKSSDSSYYSDEESEKLPNSSIKRLKSLIDYENDIELTSLQLEELKIQNESCSKESGQSEISLDYG